MNFKVLVVEDEKSIRELLVGYLKQEEYEVVSAGDGLEAIQLFNEFTPHILILDRMLPGISGEQVCQEIRRISNVPIIMLTAKTTEEAKIEGFELGVDDYVTKPFSAREVMVRVKALLNRSYPDKKENNVFNDGNLKVDFKLKNIYLKDKLIELTANEFTVLEILIRNRPQPLTRGQIVENAFSYEYQAFERNIDTYIKNIRHKIEESPKKPSYIITKYGIGYYFGG